MSFDINGYIQKNSISETILENAIIDFFGNNIENATKTQPKYGNIYYENICDKMFHYICFSKSYKSSYYLSSPAIMSGIKGVEFEYEQAIYFSMNKTDLSKETIAQVIKFFACLRKKINCDILVVSDSHNEICQLKKGEFVWAENSKGYKDICFC